MLKRLVIYCKEMFPLPMHIFLSFIAFFEIYFILLLNYNITEFNIGIQEIIGGLTILTFLLFLRIADDFKDYETDLKLHPERPVPSGRVKKKDLIILGISTLAVIIVLNLMYMNNILFLAITILYGIVMSIWFCNSEKLKKDFIFMMFTHTPYLLLMNIYVISFTCIKYGLEAISYISFVLTFTLYFIGFIRGIAREIKIPQKDKSDATDVEMEKYKKYSAYVGILAVLNTVVNIILVWKLNIISIVFLIVNLIWLLLKIKQFIKKPESFSVLNKVLVYVFVQESIVILSGIGYLIFGKI